MKKTTTPFEQYNLAFIDRNKSFNISTHWDDYTVDPGVINSASKGAFTTGQCHALALELHRRTGWELYGYFGYRDKDTPGHVVVRHPEGYIIDITGILPSSNSWNRSYTLQPVKREDVLRYHLYDYRKPNLEAASLFVDAVLARVEKQLREK